MPVRLEEEPEVTGLNPDRKVIEIILPEKLLTRLDQKLADEGVFHSRSEAICQLIREFVGARVEASDSS